MKNLNSKITPNLRVKFAEKNIKQKEIANLLGVTPQQVSRWVNGEAIPSLETSLKMAYIIECDVKDLWHFELIEEHNDDV